MPKKIEITCDYCNKDLTTVESGWDEYRLCLSAQGIHNTSNISFGMGDIHLPIKHDCYFCDLSCLEGWLTKRADDLAKRRAKSQVSGDNPPSA